jgi:hypothetical protein
MSRKNCGFKQSIPVKKQNEAEVIATIKPKNNLFFESFIDSSVQMPLVSFPFISVGKFSTNSFVVGYSSSVVAPASFM